MTWQANSLEDLPKIAQELIPKIRFSLIQFKGEMGVGKTTFIKELLHQMQCEDEVTSPTYSLVNEYKTTQGTVFHFDFYRIEDEMEAYDMGWEEYAYSGNLCLVEWPERISGLIPEKSHILEILNQDGIRKIIFD